MEKINNIICNDLNNKLESLIIEGLNRKGFFFKNKLELYNFIKLRCRKENHLELKRDVYFIDEIPFFVHYYNHEVNIETKTGQYTTELIANYGRYSFV